jgi:hypothetical protein
MTAQELLNIARKGRPNVRYAVNKAGNAIGAWDTDKGRFVIVAGLLLTGKWANMPVELLVNGKPTVDACDWIEK